MTKKQLDNLINKHVYNKLNEAFSQDSSHYDYWTYNDKTKDIIKQIKENGKLDDAIRYVFHTMDRRELFERLQDYVYTYIQSPDENTDEITETLDIQVNKGNDDINTAIKKTDSEITKSGIDRKNVNYVISGKDVHESIRRRKMKGMNENSQLYKFKDFLRLI